MAAVCASGVEMPLAVPGGVVCHSLVYGDTSSSCQGWLVVEASNNDQWMLVLVVG